MELKIQDLLSSNRYFLHDLDNKQASYLVVDEKTLLTSSFLDRRINAQTNSNRFKVNIDQILRSDIFLSRKFFHPQAYIFHLSHVGSTLLAKALGSSSKCLSLREPVPLRSITSLYKEAGLPHSWISSDRLELLTKFVEYHLARPINLRNEIVVKCTSWVNEISHLLLKPNIGAVFLYCSASNFIANFLKKGGGIHDLIGGAPSRVRRLNLLQTEKTIKLIDLSLGEIAAMSWLCEMLTLHKAASLKQFNPIWCNFDHYLIDPVNSTVDLAYKLKLSWNESDTGTLVRSGVLNKYSKTNGSVEYNANTRAEQLASIANENSTEINKGLSWLKYWINLYPELETFAFS